MSGNTSATGGPLAPVPGTPVPLEGQALLDFLQGWLVGLSGLPGQNVTPTAQPEELIIPNQGECWLAFGIATRTSDTYPPLIHNGAANSGNGQSTLRRQQVIDMRCSFYDLGSGAHAGYYADLVADAMTIPQNLELLTLNGFGYRETRPQVTAPVMTKSRWLYRIDLPVVLSRANERTYAIENVLSAAVTIAAQTERGNLTENILAS
jgi:hypothetical protein